ncbi:helix-turn-helix domain-containing protein [Arthrobacter sp. HLT1-21]
MQQLGLIDTREAARRLSTSPRTVNRMANDGRLPAKRLPGYRGDFLFEPAAVDALADSRKAGPE